MTKQILCKLKGYIHENRLKRRLLILLLAIAIDAVVYRVVGGDLIDGIIELFFNLFAGAWLLMAIWYAPGYRRLGDLIRFVNRRMEDLLLK